MEKELFSLRIISTNWVVSHSSWKALKIKTFKTKRLIIIVADYHIWPAKLILKYVTMLASKLQI